MKKILLALALAGFTCYGAEAQTINVSCGAPEGKVCKRVKGEGISCYKTKYAENFQICKTALGYKVCCEEANETNSTYGRLPLASVQQSQVPPTTYYVLEGTAPAQEGMSPDEQADMLAAPQSQSYPLYSANTSVMYEGYYPVHHIKVCQNTNNVAQANRAPYKGCPAPAYDGPDKERARNVNFTNPNSSFPQPPITGNKQ